MKLYLFSASCIDGIKSPEEEGIDCGGICEDPCGSSNLYLTYILFTQIN